MEKFHELEFTTFFYTPCINQIITKFELIRYCGGSLWNIVVKGHEM